MKSSTRLVDLTQGALFLALLIVFALIPALPIGFLPVPIVLQNLAVMLIVLILGPKRGTLVMVAFLILVACGMPILSGGRGGLAVLVGPTAGYIWSWLLMPGAYWLLNRLVFGKKPVDRAISWQSFILLAIVDIVVVYGLGAGYLHVDQGLNFWAMYRANFVFIPGDLLKVALAVAVNQALARVK
ncbi:biotin transporter BioY [Fructobacillus ficulneus]|uniref:Biotin transporter n=1 Tax=Fructobacillus ficulneus TaxID=157463 RepID=A0A0K8MJ55_9LACO|nr:biotin transporter BioY [Fructobacillus ficulneus]GAP00473.1 BioY family protein [Fructobacillus ficulneus]